MTYHPVSGIFPLMEGEEYALLRDDIALNGLQVPICLHPDGSILDGRNRYRACIDTGVEPEFFTYDGDLEMERLIVYVISLNLSRRHLDSGQRAFCALTAEEMLAKAARERQEAQGHRGIEGGRGHKREENGETLPEIFPEGSECPDCHNPNPRWDPADEPPDDRDFQQCYYCGYVMLAGDAVPQIFAERDDPIVGEARELAAKLFHTNPHYVSDAKRINAEARDLAEAVKSGEMKLPEARRELKKRQAKEAPPLPSDKFRVIYADPPWRYSNTMPDYASQADDHYPLMSIDDLCALKVNDLAEENAVLFLWVTSPVLEESFQVVRAWGFKYKACFVWDKVKHNMGHYNSVRHEFLLVCVRGSCQPDERKLFDSVQTIERTEHSVKPEEFRVIIDTLYPNGKRLELFARRSVEGWEVYGNEI